jgi:hypothetical protein
VFWHPTILVRFAGEPQSLEKGFGCNLRPQHGRCEPETDEIDSAAPPVVGSSLVGRTRVDM